MTSITLITSVIDVPNISLSYTTTRSVFTKEQRFQHTKLTISSVREKIPDTKIFLIECSLLSEEEITYFKKHVEYFYNIYDYGDEKLINRMFTNSKAMGEGTMTITALKFLFENNIEFDNLFKLSGRYWLNEAFNYDNYDNNMTCVYKINNDANNTFTCFYKLSRNITYKWLEFLLNSESDFIQCVGYENIFAKFLKTIDEKIRIIHKNIGLNGYVSVCGSFIEL